MASTDVWGRGLLHGNQWTRFATVQHHRAHFVNCGDCLGFGRGCTLPDTIMAVAP